MVELLCSAEGCSPWGSTAAGNVAQSLRGVPEAAGKDHIGLRRWVSMPSCIRAKYCIQKLDAKKVL